MKILNRPVRVQHPKSRSEQPLTIKNATLLICGFKEELSKHILKSAPDGRGGRRLSLIVQLLCDDNRYTNGPGDVTPTAGQRSESRMRRLGLYGMLVFYGKRGGAGSTFLDANDRLGLLKTDDN
ncbi:hypothetical protein EVAR_6722_1 [Eumeta japonica]|uniref:Uncharacterized protein n=1 Tax=Eumeta variegata TaxID=151549 RepID=A0A4C1V5T2_EUMVA|nr:hypothetical protein EVAR_6722_1 [Eumeta japonica]